MNYLLLHYFLSVAWQWFCFSRIEAVMVCICSRRISGYSTKKTNSYDIDDFINQLLSSQKFDELADKVAEKAVKRIKNIAAGDHVLDKILGAKHSSELGEMEQEKFRNHGSNEGEGSKKVDKDSIERRLKEIHHDDDEDPKHRERAEEIHKKGNDKQAKINTQALLKKEHNSEEAELSLKYKYLKKHARDEKEHNQHTEDSSERNPWTHLDNNKPKAQYFVPVIDDKEHNDDAHHSMNSDSIENGYSKKKKKSVSRYKGLDRYKHEHDEMRDDEFNSRPQFKSQQLASLPAIQVIQNGEREENKTEPSESPKQSHEDIEAAVKNKPKRTPKIDMIWRSRNEDSDKSDNEEEMKSQSSTTGVPGYELGELTTKRVIRREGDRFYTYLSGAEYADFHEEVARQEKKKSVHLRY